MLGTAAYMSPEQARGRSVDKRADIWAFGCVFYEILTGRRAFQAETMTEVFASVLAREADFSLLPHRLHPKIVDLVRRCLEKDIRKRWQAAGDLRVELESVLADPGRFNARIARQGQSAFRIAALVLAGVLVGGIASAVVSRLRETPTQTKITRFSIVLPQDQTFTRPGRHILAVSPDGTTLVYVANNRLYSRRMSELDAQPIPGTEQDVNSPFFSPDGQWVGFFSFRDNTLKKIPLTGGVAVTLCPATNPYGVSWTDNTIIFGQEMDGVLAVSANGGKPEVWASVEPGEVAASPQILPGGQAALFTVTKATGANRWDKSDIVVRSRNSDERKVLIQGGSAARYVSTGHLVYAVGASILAAPFDLQRLEVTGAAIPIVESVARVVGPEGQHGCRTVRFCVGRNIRLYPGKQPFQRGPATGAGIHQPPRQR